MPFHTPAKTKRGPWGHILTLAGIAIATLIGVALLVILYFAATAPSIQEISNQQISQSTKIYDRTGQVLLYQISSGGPNRTVIAFDQIPASLKDATVELEDENFYSEPAFDWRGIARSILHDLVSPHSGLQGGSTITQQLARTAFLTLDQTITRKLKEFVLAVKLNNYYSKDQILELYLNEVPYGPNISGVETASEAYFGVPVAQINVAQAALLASLPQAPSYYSPWGTHTDELIARQRFTLQKMYTKGKINKQQLNEALAFKLTFNPQSESGIGGGIRAPHFVMAVEQYLYQKYGENMVDRGGLKVTTTLNWPMQQAAEAAITAGVARDKQLYDSNNASLVAQDPATGQILALVGSVDYFNSKNQGNFNVATQGLRQPGSSLKPFVYLTGFQSGYTPDTILYSVPTEFSTNPACPQIPNYNATTPNKSCYHPQNFEGTFTGPMTVRDALAQSVNITAVQMLYLVGEQNAISNITNFGVTTLGNATQYGLSLVLGGGAVHLIDLTEAYSVLSQDGVKHTQTMILGVQDSSGNNLETYQDQTATVADQESVRLTNAILSDPSARAPLFQASQNLTVFPGYDVALKTGTSNDYRDAWAMGYTPSLVVGVWAGNNNNTPMKKQGSSILAAVPMWNAFLTQALPMVPNATFTPPDPQPESKPILAGQYVIDGQIHSTLYYVSKDNPAGPPPANPNNDPQYKNWEAGVQNWVSYNPTILTSQGSANSNQFNGSNPSAPTSTAG